MTDFAALHTEVSQIYTESREVLLNNLKTCIQSLFEQITCADDDLVKTIKQEAAIPIENGGQNRCVIWQSTENRISWNNECFSLRLLLKGPDRGGVYGYPWLTRKGVTPLLQLLKDHYQPFDVHFTQNGRKGIRIVISWP